MILEKRIAPEARPADRVNHEVLCDYLLELAKVRLLCDEGHQNLDGLRRTRSTARFSMPSSMHLLSMLCIIAKARPHSASGHFCRRPDYSTNPPVEIRLSALRPI